MKNSIQKLGAALLSSALSLSALPVSVLAREAEPSNASRTILQEESAKSKKDAKDTTKTETVYSFLDENGNISKTIVTSWLHNPNGLGEISENLKLSDVQDLKEDNKPTVSGDVYTWNVNGNDLYYQGTSREKLPVQIKVTYSLDGKTMTAEQLKGKSGHLKMNVEFVNDQKKTVNLNGKNVIIHPLFAAGGLMDLDGKIFSNISCEQGETINDGEREFLMFAALPGLTETMDSAGLSSFTDKLGASDDVTIEADVKDFEVPQMYFGATNEIQLSELSDMDDLSELTSKLQPLFDGADQLVDGAAKLSDGADQLLDGTNSLTDGMGALKDGSGKLHDGSSQLKDGTAAAQDGTADLEAGAKRLAEGTDALVSGSSKLTAGTAQLESGAKSAQDGVNKLSKGSDDLAAGTEQLESGSKSLSDGTSQFKTKVDALTGRDG
ncbi:hypothetical protein [Allobaculum sp. Allo2]|nr:hypothetical protein [Allobaculum sp. Allo2]UNT93452.1 hypothetical protein KWG61_01095 [Allobaculum sp. Allo2]